FETAPRWDLLVLNRREAGIAMGDREAGIAMGDRVAGIAMGDREAGIAMGDRVAGIAMGDAESAPGALAGRAAWSVVVTDGGRGAFGVLLGEEVREAAEPVTVVDPTGAGDAFAAGLVVALDRGLSPREAVRLANRVAGRVVGIHGGTVRDRALLAGL
ncbi:MAG: hypothetical protein FJ087_04655, partial [Deltaproteobacteria bacterium]|nr:hypothetical protein [Deltaproteobacteria bacterium]